MDLDVAAPPNAISNGHAYPSPHEVEVERVPTPAPLTNGPEKGTQIEKVAELSAETTYLTLAETSTTSHPILLHCEWNPRDPKRLATAGIDTLARLWTVPSRTPSPQIDGHVVPPAFRDLVDEDENRASISAIAWTSDGEALAVASDCGDTGKINIWSREGSRIVQFNSLGYPPIICLRWGASDRTLLALTSTDRKGGSSWATVFTPPSQETATFDLGSNFQPSDAVWTGESEFAICNGELLMGFNLSDEGVITHTKSYGARKDAGPMSLAYDPHCGLLAAANEDGVIEVSLHVRYQSFSTNYS
jgi:WD40 repeat protein